MRSSRSPKPLPPESEARYSRYKAALYMAGLTDSELARRLEMEHRQHLNRVITSKAPGVAMWPRIAKALRVDVAWLLTGAGVEPEWHAASTGLKPALSSLDAAAAVVRKVSGRKGAEALEAISRARDAVAKLGG